MSVISVRSNFLVYQKGYTPEFVKDAITQNNLDGLEIFDYSRPLESINFLSAYSFLVGLKITCLLDQEYTFLRDLPKLKSLVISAAGKIRNTVDLSNQVELEDLFIDWRKGKVTGLSNCKKLESFTARTFNEDNLSALAECVRLKSVTLLNSSIKSLAGIGNFKNLEHLDLNRCGKLTSIEEISSLLSLRSLIFRNCPNVKEFGSLASLKNLESLEISACKGINSIKFVDNLDKLKELSMRENTIVLDNDLIPARRIKKLIYVQHKSYNVTILANKLAEVEKGESGNELDIDWRSG
jgi:hypothetical protein